MNTRSVHTCVRPRRDGEATFIVVRAFATASTLQSCLDKDGRCKQHRIRAHSVLLSCRDDGQKLGRVAHLGPGEVADRLVVAEVWHQWSALFEDQASSTVGKDIARHKPRRARCSARLPAWSPHCSLNVNRELGHQVLGGTRLRPTEYQGSRFGKVMREDRSGHTVTNRMRIIQQKVNAKRAVRWGGRSRSFALTFALALSLARSFAFARAVTAGGDARWVSSNEDVQPPQG
mmetsp:Transcript_15284/g.47719  ORF Transcript_15284/g.47719 Transcript_15284/m.47719 type:complete len:232 (+) Transcript_15284:141-836(+)